MQQVLVTGAGGYIGTILVPMLLAEGYGVRAVDRFFFGGDLLPRHRDLERIKGDCRRLDGGLLRGIDAVIDLAAISDDASGELFLAATWEINFQARLRTASLAKQAGVRRYLLASSCNVYGVQGDGATVDETAPVNPLTTYARTNHKAERGALALADERFDVVVLRQAALYGLSPRMRFDLLLNAMTYDAWRTGRLALMRDGSQWRPLLHVSDSARAICTLLRAESAAVNGEIFNVGADGGNYQIGALAGIVARALGREIEIDWYGNSDRKSVRVAFGKLSRLGWSARYTVEDGVAEIVEALACGEVERTPETITADWYMELVRWQRLVREVELHDGILDLDVGPQPPVPPDWGRVAGEAEKLMARLRRRAL